MRFAGLTWATKVRRIFRWARFAIYFMVRFAIKIIYVGMFKESMVVGGQL